MLPPIYSVYPESALQCNVCCRSPFLYLTKTEIETEREDYSLSSPLFSPFVLTVSLDGYIASLRQSVTGRK